MTLTEQNAKLLHNPPFCITRGQLPYANGTTIFAGVRTSDEDIV